MFADKKGDSTMLNEFLAKEKLSDIIAVLPPQDSHPISLTLIAPIVTTSNQVGIIFQDKKTGNRYFIEIDTIDEEVAKLPERVKVGFDLAYAIRKKLTLFNKEKHHGT
jgi:hypothetical protein